MSVNSNFVDPIYTQNSNKATGCVKTTTTNELALELNTLYEEQKKFQTLISNEILKNPDNLNLLNERAILKKEKFSEWWEEKIISKDLAFYPTIFLTALTLGLFSLGIAIFYSLPRKLKTWRIDAKINYIALKAIGYRSMSKLRGINAKIKKLEKQNEMLQQNFQYQKFLQNKEMVESPSAQPSKESSVISL